jgi:hypothetical protein
MRDGGCFFLELWWRRKLMVVALRCHFLLLRLWRDLLLLVFESGGSGVACSGVATAS